MAVLVRGDHDVNEVKVKNALGATELALAPAEKVMEVTGAPVGFAGPVGLKGVKILADNALKDGHDYVTGALVKDKHLIHVEIGTGLRRALVQRLPKRGPRATGAPNAANP